MSAISLNQLTKHYGRRRGVADVTFEVRAGSLFGLIGPNGAGKSTTIRTLLGLLRPTAGSARLLGDDVTTHGPRCRARVGYVPGENQFDPSLTVQQVLAWRAAFHPGDHRARQAELIELFDLDRGARAEELSLGNKKKLALVAALQHRPEVLVLDEPTNGLDPVMQARLFEVLEAEAKRGVAVLFSSHVLSEVQRVCRTVAVLADGRVVAIEDVETLRRRQLRRVHVQGATEGLERLGGVRDWQPTPHGAVFLYAGEPAPLLTALAAQPLADVRIEEPSLEEIVLQHYLKVPEAAHG